MNSRACGLKYLGRCIVKVLVCSNFKIINIYNFKMFIAIIRYVLDDLIYNVKSYFMIMEAFLEEIVD